MENPDNRASWYTDNDYWYRGYSSFYKQEHNAALVWYWLKKRFGANLSINAVAGLLGNMEVESTCNPGKWEKPVNDPLKWYNGYGLVQWSSSNFNPYIKWAIGEESYSGPHEYLITKAEQMQSTWDGNGPLEMQRIYYEAQNGLEWMGNQNATQSGLPATPAFSMMGFFTNTIYSAWQCAEAWLWYYERPANPPVGYRGDLAQNYWLPYLQSLPPWRGGLPIYMMLRRHGIQ